MGLDLTWIALAASLLMALGGACVFVFAVKKDYFRDIEDAKFHVFWSDLAETVNAETIDNDSGASLNERNRQAK